MVASMHTAAADALRGAVVELRKRSGQTQRELAAALGREQSYVGRIETGQRRIDLIEWITICRACSVDPQSELRKLVKRLEPMVPARIR
jgi:transcriptional regulator with XRE-family HTH domain